MNTKSLLPPMNVADHAGMLGDLERAHIYPEGAVCMSTLGLERLNEMRPHWLRRSGESFFSTMLGALVIVMALLFTAMGKLPLLDFTDPIALALLVASVALLGFLTGLSFLHHLADKSMLCRIDGQHTRYTHSLALVHRPKTRGGIF